MYLGIRLLALAEGWIFAEDVIRWRYRQSQMSELPVLQRCFMSPWLTVIDRNG